MEERASSARDGVGLGSPDVLLVRVEEGNAPAQGGADAVWTMDEDGDWAHGFIILSPAEGTIPASQEKVGVPHLANGQPECGSRYEKEVGEPSYRSTPTSHADEVALLRKALLFVAKGSRRLAKFALVPLAGAFPRVCIQALPDMRTTPRGHRSPCLNSGHGRKVEGSPQPPCLGPFTACCGGSRTSRYEC